MRRWWLRQGSWWLLLLLIAMGLATYANDALSEYASHNGLPVVPWWLLVGFWFPVFAVGVWLVGAMEASHYADKLLESSTIPDARFPLKARAVLCFAQGVWPGSLVAVVLVGLCLLRNAATLYPGLRQAPFSLCGALSVQGLDFLEFALVGLWVVGLLVVTPNRPWMSIVWLVCFFLYSGQYCWVGGVVGRPPLGWLPEGLSPVLSAVSFVAITACIVLFARGLLRPGFQLFWLLVAGTVLGAPAWMGSAAYTPPWMREAVDSFLPCAIDVHSNGHLFCWTIPELNDPLIVGFVNAAWVGVQYLVFFNFVFADALTAPTRRSRR